MKIKELRLHPQAIADGPLRSSYGLHAPYALRTIVEVVTTDGITGISETYGGDRPLAALEAARSRVVGMNPFDLTRFWQYLNGDTDKAIDPAGARSQTMLVPGENPLDEAARTFAAIEIACLDAIGQAVNEPLCDLIGGRARDAAPFSAYLFYKHAGGGGTGSDAREDKYGECLSPETIVEQCRRFIEEYSFREIKLKGGVLDPEVEIETIRALRAAFGPSYPLRIDPNCAWSVDTSVQIGIALREELSGGGYLEDPCASLEGMAEVRKRLLAEGVNTLFASNVATTCFAHVPQAKELDAVQIILSDPHYWGGLRKQKQLSELCEVLGLGLSMHSNNHLGVSMMTMAHAACASPHLTHACDTHYPWQTEIDEVIVGGRVKFVDGAVPIPDKPGLGVTLDYDQLARGVERYNNLPFRKRDDTAEMRKHVDPNWERILPRW
ncbi:enolase C-terminal domain-like protein [Bryobacter aggregatus]|uniref:enolase C-terminal domain-like protein n=1 Tax=Bryobacter aggregatus TaxID=360054 RepID=UPI0004E0CCA3|nr:enolase C-terminal domain-like protein [Bryobacter aggregatus]